MARNKSFWDWLWNDPPMDIRVANVKRANADGDMEEIVAWRIKSGNLGIDVTGVGDEVDWMVRHRDKKLIEVKNGKPRKKAREELVEGVE